MSGAPIIAVAALGADAPLYVMPAELRLPVPRE